VLMLRSSPPSSLESSRKVLAFFFPADIATDDQSWQNVQHLSNLLLLVWRWKRELDASENGTACNAVRVGRACRHGAPVDARGEANNWQRGDTKEGVVREPVLVSQCYVLKAAHRKIPTRGQFVDANSTRSHFEGCGLRTRVSLVVLLCVRHHD
jgi:hypothetical protein